VPISIRVVLVGLKQGIEDAKGSLPFVMEAQALQSLLGAMLPKRHLHYLSNGRSLQTQFVLNYTVQHAEDISVRSNWQSALVIVWVITNPLFFPAR
jgi:hypothetical protein